MKNTLQLYHDLIAGIVAAMDARDPYTATHSERVGDMAFLLCRMMRITESTTETIHIAGHIHDIGKIGIPDAILIKAAALNDDEWGLMRKHSEIGFHILEKISGFEEIAEIVRHHHERWDGGGYPDGLSGDQIPLGSRIIALADSIDAMLSNRQYRQAMTLEACRQEIEKNSGMMYDPVIAELVLRNWQECIWLIYGDGLIKPNQRRRMADG